MRNFVIVLCGQEYVQMNRYLFELPYDRSEQGHAG